MNDVEASDDHNLYGSLAPVYEFVYDRHFDYEAQLDVVRETIPETEASILEVGCGTGQLLALLDATYEHVVGVDLHDEMSAIARAAVPAVDVITGDMTTLAIDEQFDGVVMLGRVVPHCLTDDAATRLLENCRTHLVPGGWIVFNTFDWRGFEDGRVSEDTYTSDAFEVRRTLESFVTDEATGRWGFDAVYVITDRETDTSVTAKETMHLRAHTPDDLRTYLTSVGYEDVSLERESTFSLRAVARNPSA